MGTAYSPRKRLLAADDSNLFLGDKVRQRSRQRLWWGDVRTSERGSGAGTLEGSR